MLWRGVCPHDECALTRGSMYPRGLGKRGARLVKLGSELLPSGHETDRPASVVFLAKPHECKGLS